MSRTALVMFAVTTLVGCTNAIEADDLVAPADNVRPEVGDVWRSADVVTAEGRWTPPTHVVSVRTAQPLSLGVSSSNTVRDEYLADESPAAAGLLGFVNTATIDELDRQVGGSSGAVVGSLVASRPFQTVAGLRDVQGVTDAVLDELLQHALVSGYVEGFNHEEVIFSVAGLAESSGWDLNQSFGDQLRPMNDHEVEQSLGTLPGEIRTTFRESHEMDWVALSVTTYAIEAYGVSVGYAFSVVTNDPSVERFGTHYFVDASDDSNVLIEADFVAD